MKKLSVVIVESNPRELEQLKSILEIGYNAEVIDEAEDAQQALERKTTLKNADVIFINIKLGKNNRAGLDLAHHLNSNFDDPPYIIFTNDCEKLARESIKEHPVAYLMKPVETSALLEALNYVNKKKLVSYHFADERIEISYYENEEDKNGKRKTGGFKPSQIVCVSKNQTVNKNAIPNTVRIRLNNGKILHGVPGTVKTWKGNLYQPYFEQIHRSHVVNLSYAKNIEKHPHQKECSELHFKCWDDPLRIGDRYCDGLAEKIIMWKED